MDEGKSRERQKKWAKIVAKVWADEDYKRRLLDDPASVLKAEGVDMPEGLEIKIVEAPEKQALFVLPPRPTNSCEVQEGEERLAAACCDYFSQCVGCCNTH